jgi:hypothetical protein
MSFFSRRTFLAQDMDVRIESPLPVDELQRRIEASFEGGQRGVWLYAGPWKMLGRMTGDQVSATLAGRDPNGQGFGALPYQAWFTGRAIPTSSGSALAGSVGSSTLEKRFLMVFWGLFLVFAALMIVVPGVQVAITTDKLLTSALAGALGAAFALGFGAFFALIMWMLRNARDRNATELVRRLRSLVETDWP